MNQNAKERLFNELKCGIMRKMNFYLMLLGIAWYAVACSGNDDIDGVEPLSLDYELPQGKSDADDRIVDYYEQFGTYILYDFSSVDYYYGMSTRFQFNLPDPVYVGDMLDLLEEIWFDFYPEEFNKQYMPYKLMLTEYTQEPWGDGYNQLFAVAGTNPAYCYSIGFCTDTLQKLKPETKVYFKNEIQRRLWMDWVKRIELPEEFFAVSDYSTRVMAYDPNDENYARKRGFVADYVYGYDNEWSGSYVGNTSYDIEVIHEYDARAYLTRMAAHPYADWASDLEYPLVKQKYDILNAWLVEHYGIHLQDVGNATYE